MVMCCSALAWVSSGIVSLNFDISSAKIYPYIFIGRFGNQMSQYIGAIAFAKGLDRTLVLPPFVKYRPMTAGSVSCVLCNVYASKCMCVFY